MRSIALRVSVALTMCGAASPLLAQTPAAVSAERLAWADWLAHAPTSPGAAVVQQPIGRGVTLGPDTATVPLPGISAARIVYGRPTRLESASGSTVLVPGRPTRLGPYLVVLGGPDGRNVVTVFDSAAHHSTPSWYTYDPSLVFTGPLMPADTPADERLLAPDGVEVVAQVVGTVRVLVGDSAVRLTVKRIPDPVTNESQLEIFFRDATNARGSYPAGRFVALVPMADGRYRLDFNRARNPFCAYSAAYACPAPWRGNVIPRALEAGERYVERP